MREARTPAPPQARRPRSVHAARGEARPQVQYGTVLADVSRPYAAFYPRQAKVVDAPVEPLEALEATR